MMKLTKILWIFIGLVPIAHLEFIYRFKQIQCAASGKSAKFLFCYPRTYDRKIFTLNIGIELLRSMDGMMVSGKLLNFDQIFFIYFIPFSWISPPSEKTQQEFLKTCIRVAITSTGVRRRNMRVKTNSSAYFPMRCALPQRMCFSIFARKLAKSSQTTSHSRNHRCCRCGQTVITEYRWNFTMVTMKKS